MILVCQYVINLTILIYRSSFISLPKYFIIENFHGSSINFFNNPGKIICIYLMQYLYIIFNNFFTTDMIRIRIHHKNHHDLYNENNSDNKCDLICQLSFNILQIEILQEFHLIPHPSAVICYAFSYLNTIADVPGSVTITLPETMGYSCTSTSNPSAVVSITHCITPSLGAPIYHTSISLVIS